MNSYHNKWCVSHGGRTYPAHGHTGVLVIRKLIRLAKLSAFEEYPSAELAGVTTFYGAGRRTSVVVLKIPIFTDFIRGKFVAGANAISTNLSRIIVRLSSKGRVYPVCDTMEAAWIWKRAQGDAWSQEILLYLWAWWKPAGRKTAIVTLLQDTNRSATVIIPGIPIVALFVHW